MSGALILIGRVAGGFGVRGEVRITTYTEDPMALARYRELKREDGSPAITLQSARSVPGGVIGRAAEIASKEAADALRGLNLYVPRTALAPPGEDEFYLADLVGLRAQTLRGDPLGTVKAVHNFGAGDVLELEPASGGATILVAFTRDIVPEVRIDEGYVEVSLPAEDETLG